MEFSKDAVYEKVKGLSNEGRALKRFSKDAVYEKVKGVLAKKLRVPMKRIEVREFSRFSFPPYQIVYAYDVEQTGPETYYFAIKGENIYSRILEGSFSRLLAEIQFPEKKENIEPGTMVELLRLFLISSVLTPISSVDEAVPYTDRLTEYQSKIHPPQYSESNGDVLIIFWMWNRLGPYELQKWIVTITPDHQVKWEYEVVTTVIP